MIDGQYRKLGYYDVQADNLTWHNAEQWIGGKVRKLKISQKPGDAELMKNFILLYSTRCRKIVR